MRIPLLVLLTVATLGAAERLNHEGRILVDTPVVPAGTGILFNTAEADAIVSTLQIMPRDNAWNEDISARPLLGNNGSAALSNAMITMIRDDVYDTTNGPYANRRRLVVFEEMNYVLVSESQPLVGMRFVTYPNDSDYNGGANPVATWPVPTNMPIETWPTGTGSQTLTQWQQASGGDRHSIIVQPGATPRIFETWQARLTANTPNWQASNGAIFPLDNNLTGRAPGDTSGDAAGLPMFPALVRYDECQRGVVEHAMRVVVKRSRQSYLYPASHQAGSTTDTNVPAMGQRLRLKSSFSIPGSWSNQERAVAVALMKYGALVADNGNFFSISICPDDRWPAGCWDHFTTGAGSDYLDINNFEVVETTGATGGPRSAGAPTCNAGPDQGVLLAGTATLAGSATGTGLTTLWEVYPTTPPAPGTVTFTNVNANSLTPTASFSAVGTYTLRLKASDGTHTPAYDTVVISVSASSNPLPTLSGINPATRTQHGAAFTLTLTGSNFVPTSQVAWSGRTNLIPATISANQLTVSVPAGYLSLAGTPTITVVNPQPGGGTSSGQVLTITAAAPAPGGGGGGGGGGGAGAGGGGGGCGLGGAVAALLAFGALWLRRLR